MKRKKERRPKKEVTRNEVGLHIKHEQDTTSKGVWHKASDVVLVNMSVEAAMTPQEET